MQKIIKLSFLTFSADLFYFSYFALKTYGTLNMFLLSVQINFYIIISSYVKGHVKKSSCLNFQNLDVF